MNKPQKLGEILSYAINVELLKEDKKFGIEGIQKNKLRQRVIEHIKYIKAGNITNSSGLRLRTAELIIVDFLIYNFNLTEEELK